MSFENVFVDDHCKNQHKMQEMGDNASDFLKMIKVHPTAAVIREKEKFEN